MGILGTVWFIIVCFFKFVIFLVSLIVAIPMLFILSGIVFAITGFIIFIVCAFLDKHTNLMLKLYEKLEKWILIADKWTEQFQKKDDDSDATEDDFDEM